MAFFTALKAWMAKHTQKRMAYCIKERTDWSPDGDRMILSTDVSDPG